MSMYKYQYLQLSLHATSTLNIILYRLICHLIKVFPESIIWGCNIFKYFTMN